MMMHALHAKYEGCFKQRSWREAAGSVKSLLIEEEMEMKFFFFSFLQHFDAKMID